MKTIIDARGKLCPEPVIMTKAAITANNGVGEIEVLVDNMLVVQNISKYVEKNNYSMTYNEASDHSYTVHIILSNDDASSDSTPAPVEETNINKGTVVAIHSNVLGQGNDELGAILMKGFIYALTKTDSYPETILFYNGGVRLTTGTSDSLEDLTYLASCGVEILSCGTCLNHYQLTDSLRVGEVTNMYSIVEKMTTASKVITP